MIIDNILFNVDDKKFTSIHRWAFSIFKLLKDTNNDKIELCKEQDLNHKAYKVEINFLQLFHLVISFVSCEALFQMIACLIDVTKAMSYMGCFSRCNEDHVASFMKVFYNVSLQKIFKLFYKHWAFLLAFDVGSK